MRSTISERLSGLPDITHLEVFQVGMQIAAVWLQGPGSSRLAVALMPLFTFGVLFHVEFC